MKLRALFRTTTALRVLLTVTAAGAAFVAGHGFLGLLAILAYAWASSMMAAGPGNTAKTRDIEYRLNRAMPRIPWPQADPGPAGNSSYSASNSSYGPGNNSYSSGNYSYPIGGGGMGGNNNRWSSNQGAGTVEPWSHAHTIDHTHDFGSLPGDFNNLRNSYSDTVTAFNALRQDHSSLVSCVGQLRTSHSDMITAYNALRDSHSSLLDAHNDIRNRLSSANILQ